MKQLLIDQIVKFKQHSLFIISLKLSWILQFTFLIVTKT